MQTAITTHAELSRAQRAAYFAWQAAPAGRAAAPLAAYLAASDALEAFNAAQQPAAPGAAP